MIRLERTGDWKKMYAELDELLELELAKRSVEIVIEETMKQVQDNLPKGIYKDSFKLKEVDDSQMAVVTDAKLENAEDIPENTVIYFEDTDKVPGGIVLKSFAPWFKSALPLVEGIEGCTAYYRVIREKEFDMLKIAYSKKLRKAEANLRQLKVKFLVGTYRGKIKMDTRFKGSRMEFGIAGEPSVPHLRKVVSERNVKKILDTVNIDMLKSKRREKVDKATDKDMEAIKSFARKL